MPPKSMLQITAREARWVGEAEKLSCGGQSCQGGSLEADTGAALAQRKQGRVPSTLHHTPDCPESPFPLAAYMGLHTALLQPRQAAPEICIPPGLFLAGRAGLM